MIPQLLNQSNLLAMHIMPLFAASIGRLWHLLPLLLSISLVYAGTRHEELKQILKHAFQFSAWIFGFMVLIALGLEALEMLE